MLVLGCPLIGNGMDGVAGTGQAGGTGGNFVGQWRALTHQICSLGAFVASFDPTWLNLVRTSGGDLEEGRGYRFGGGAGLVVGRDYQGPLAVGSANEILDA